MSFLGGGRSYDGSELDGGPVTEHLEKRRETRSGRLCSGTLACPHCDAPVAIGSEPRRLTDVLACPYCEHTGPVRDFLSLEPPVRPTRVVVRVGRLEWDRRSRSGG
ncbi:MAG: hypothetical protein WAK93_05810 [Solirubrobacteraceae bacterium]